MCLPVCLPCCERADSGVRTAAGGPPRAERGMCPNYKYLPLGPWRLFGRIIANPGFKRFHSNARRRLSTVSSRNISARRKKPAAQRKHERVLAALSCDADSAHPLRSHSIVIFECVITTIRRYGHFGAPRSSRTLHSSVVHIAQRMARPGSRRNWPTHSVIREGTRAMQHGTRACFLWHRT